PRRQARVDRAPGRARVRARSMGADAPAAVRPRRAGLYRRHPRRARPVRSRLRAALARGLAGDRARARRHGGPMTSATTIQLVGATAPRVADVWRTLEEHARPSYFLTWGWIENWLSCLPTDNLPRLAVVSGASGPFAAFFVGRRRLVRHG